MDFILTAVSMGVIGTLMMDLGNFIFARIRLVIKIDLKMIGRMSAGWFRGRFFYPHPDEMQKTSNELFLGCLTHYIIGLVLAIIFLLGWNVIVGGNVSPLWTFIYGILTTAVSYFWVYPSMGLGIFGKKSPEGLKAAISSLVNHLFFGIGMVIGLILIDKLV